MQFTADRMSGGSRPGDYWTPPALALEEHANVFRSIGPALGICCRDERANQPLLTALRLLFPAVKYFSCQLAITPDVCVTIGNLKADGHCQLALLHRTKSLAGACISSAAPVSSSTATDRLHRLVDLEHVSCVVPGACLLAVPLLYGMGEPFIKQLAQAAGQGEMAVWDLYGQYSRTFPCIGSITLDVGSTPQPLRSRLLVNSLLLAGVAATHVLHSSKLLVEHMAIMVGIMLIGQPYGYVPGVGVVPEPMRAGPAAHAQHTDGTSASLQQSRETADSQQPAGKQRASKGRSGGCQGATGGRWRGDSDDDDAGLFPSSPGQTCSMNVEDDAPLDDAPRVPRRHAAAPASRGAGTGRQAPGSGTAACSQGPQGADWPNEKLQGSKRSSRVAGRCYGVPLEELAAAVDGGGLQQDWLLLRFLHPTIECCFHRAWSAHQLTAFKHVYPVLYAVMCYRLAVAYPFEWLRLHPYHFAFQLLLTPALLLFNLLSPRFTRFEEVLSMIYYCCYRCYQAPLMYYWALPRVVADGTVRDLLLLAWLAFISPIMTCQIITVRWSLWPLPLVLSCMVWTSLVPYTANFRFLWPLVPSGLPEDSLTLYAIGYASVLLTSLVLPAATLFFKERSFRWLFKRELLAEIGAGSG